MHSSEVSSRRLIDEALERALDPTGEGPLVFTKLYPEQSRKVAEAIDQLQEAGYALSPIAGLPISVKDLFAIRGEVTTAGSVALRSLPPATSDATVIRRLRQAGAVIVGKTNMTEFAYSGVGLNPHYGTPANPFDRKRRLIPGGSSSGAAVSVSDGMARAAVGSDTGGSVRIPAALCGLTGFKPTQARIPLDGVFPLSPTLDSVGVIAPTVSLCGAVEAVMAGEQADDCVRPANLQALVFGVPANYLLNDLAPQVAQAFDRALRILSAAGARVAEAKFAELDRIPAINAAGGFAAAESYAFHRRFSSRWEAYDPFVLERIQRGAAISAAEYLDLQEARQAVIEDFDRTAAGFDIILSPTVPIPAPEMKTLLEDAGEYRRINSLLLRNPSVANFLDRCSLSLPCQKKDEPPVGLMLIGRRFGDRDLLSVGARIEELLAKNFLQ